MQNQRDTSDPRKPAPRKDSIPPVALFLAIALFAAWALFFGPPLIDSLNDDTVNPLSDVEPAAGDE